MNSSVSPPRISKETIQILSGLNECTLNMKTFFQVMNVVSFVGSLVVLILKVRKRKLRHFPDNFVTTIMGQVVGLSFILSIGSFVGNEQMSRDATGFMSGLCTFQAFMFQFFADAYAWTWISGVYLMYLIIVKQTPVSTLRPLRKYFYLFNWMIALTSAVYCYAFDKYGPVEVAMFCWIDDASGWRFGFLYSHMLFGLIVIMVFAVPVIMSLYRAIRTIDDPVRIQIFRETILQQLVHAVYVFIIFSAIMLYAFNNLLLDVTDSAKHSEYIAETTYTYCEINIFVVSSIGFFVSLIFGSTYERCLRFRRMVGKITEKARFSRFSTKSQAPTQATCTSSSIAESIVFEDEGPDSFVMMGTPTSVENQNHVLGDFCNSAFDENGCTAVSVPPSESARKVHIQANTVYTQMLLSYVKERLEEEGISLSDEQLNSVVSEIESNHRSTLSKRSKGDSVSRPSDSQLDIDARLALARARWLKNNNASDSSPKGSSAHVSSKDKDRKSGLDIDVQLAVARAQWMQENSRTSGSLHSSQYSSTIGPSDKTVTIEGELDLDTRLALARSRWLMENSRESSFCAVTSNTNQQVKIPSSNRSIPDLC